MSYLPSLSSNAVPLSHDDGYGPSLSPATSDCEGDSNANTMGIGGAIDSFTQGLMSFLRGNSGSQFMTSDGSFKILMEKSRTGQHIRAINKRNRLAFEVNVEPWGKAKATEHNRDLLTHCFAAMVEAAATQVAQEQHGAHAHTSPPLSPSLPSMGQRRLSTISTVNDTLDAPSSNMSLATSVLSKMEPDHFSNKTTNRSDSMDLDDGVVKPKPTKKTTPTDDRKENGLRSTLFVCAPTDNVSFLETMFEEQLRQKLGDEKEVKRPIVTIVEDRDVIEDARAYVEALDQRWWKKRCIVRAPDGTPYLPFLANGEPCGCGRCLSGVQLRAESSDGVFFKCWECSEEQAKAQWDMQPAINGGRLSALRWDIASWTPMFVKFNSQRDAKLVLSRLYQGALVTRAKKVKGWNAMAKKEREKAIGFLSRPSDHAVPRNEKPEAEFIGAIGYTDITMRQHVDLPTTVTTSVSAKIVRAAHNPRERDAVGVPRAPTYTKAHCEKRVVSIEAETATAISVIEFDAPIRIETITVDKPICALVIQPSLESKDSTLFHFALSSSVTLESLPMAARVYMFGAKIVNTGGMFEAHGFPELPQGVMTQLPAPATSYPSRGGKVDLYHASIQSFKIKPAPSEPSQ